MPEICSALRTLGDRYVAELFAHDPGAARAAGAHSHDGRLGPVGAAATARRRADLEAMAAELGALEASPDRAPATAEERAEAITLRHRLAFERFQPVSYTHLRAHETRHD